ncbi:MAG TPA: PLP-dependent aminotransferase family protein [Solirubrobacteraceae bacterium]|nr:PLP-dependent aminotransferase family protein [Solirubrobacteraceae bacterium]
MPRTWAISGVDLHLDLDGPRVRAALESALREAVSSGRLRPGTRLPSSRALAADLGIARNTVAEAYGQLAAEGWLNSVQGSGTRVADRVSAPARAASSAEPSAPSPRYDLRPGSPDVSAFPRAAWLRAARRALGQAPFSALDYDDPRGRPELRSALAEYLARARGVRASPDRILVCSGFAQASWLLCQVLRAGGARTLALEEYGLPTVRATAAACGLAVHTLPVDESGARVEFAGGADAVLLTPAHQFPLGVPLAAGRRAEALEWAQAEERLIIEDDYDGEFRYDRHPLGSLQAHAPDHVVYAGTASKTLAPGVRLAWLVVPPYLIAPLVEAKTLADRHTGVIDQLTLAELIASGGYDRHVRRSRLVYRRRRDRLIAALGRRAPKARVSGIAAGLHALVTLPAGRTEEEVIADAAARGLALLGLAGFGDGTPGHAPALVVGYAKPPEHAFTGAVARLAATLAGEDKPSSARRSR